MPAKKRGSSNGGGGPQVELLATIAASLKALEGGMQSLNGKLDVLIGRFDNLVGGVHGERHRELEARVAEVERRLGIRS